MKILRISLRNLASLAGTHTVDFTREPLRSAGLFSISGPTGSGKSTLLDALCLALYDDTPRLSAAGGVQIPDNAKGDLITQKDPGNLLRRGAAEGFAEVAFVGVDGLTYTARWMIRRAHKSSDGALQNAAMALLEGDVQYGDDGVIIASSRKNEVLAAIEAKVGLSFEQFTRAVLLAQNDFAVFLKSDDKERALILQALTGTERFERLSVAVFDRNKAESEAVLALKNQLTGLAPLDPGPRAAAQAAVKTAADEFAAAEAACAERDRHLAWFQRQQELSNAEAKAAEELNRAQQAVESAAPRRDEMERIGAIIHDARPLHDAERRETTQQGIGDAALKSATDRQAEERKKEAHLRQVHIDAMALATKATLARDAAQPELLRARALDAQLEPLAKRLVATQTERERAELAVRLSTEKYEALVSEITKQAKARQALTEQRDVLAPYAFFTTDAAAWAERLTSAHQARESQVSLTKTLALKTTAATQLATKAEQETAALAKLQGALEQSRDQRTAAELAAKGFDPEVIAAQRPTLEADQQALGLLQSHWTKLLDLTALARVSTNALRDVEAEIGKDTQALDILQRTTLPSAQTAWETSLAALALVEAAADQAVPKLRESLRPQKPCPVCGSEHHPYSSHAPTVEIAVLRSLRKQVAEKLTALESLRAQITQLTTQLQQNAKQQAARQVELTKLNTQILEERTRTPSAPTLTSLLALPEAERGPALLARQEQLTQDVRELQAQDVAQRQAMTKLAAAQLAYDQAHTAYANAERSLGELARQRAAAEAARDATSEQAGQAGQTTDTRRAALAPLFEHLHEANAKFDRDADGFIAHFNQETGRLRELEKRLVEASQLAAQAETQRGGLKDAVTAAEATLAQRRQDETTVRTEHDTLNTERKALVSGRPVAEVAVELERTFAEAAQKRDTAALALADTEKNLAATTEAMRGHQKTSDEVATRRTAAQTAMDGWLADFSSRSGRPLDRGGLAAYLTRDEAWLKAERTALDVLSAAVQTSTGARAANVKSFTDHDATRATPDDNATVRADHATRTLTRDTAKKHHIDVAAVLASDDGRRLKCAELFAQLTVRQDQAEPWGKLNELIGSADGTKFRAIVQRRTLDFLLGYANAQLDLLSARYRLERLPESLNLIVCDRDMADERRSVHSLSGGESFLVSLALALGLASLTSNRLRIESLFIDEGFGSLDPETLNTAMNALTHLESQGRKVGVISHVSEMADAIPVQIRVVKGRLGASRLLVPGAGPATEETVEETEPTKPTAKANASPEVIAALAERVLVILRRAQAEGKAQVSVTALRKELVCEAEELAAARQALGCQLITTGKNVALA